MSCKTNGEWRKNLTNNVKTNLHYKSDRFRIYLNVQHKRFFHGHV